MSSLPHSNTVWLFSGDFLSNQRKGSGLAKEEDLFYFNFLN
jgi:hypothetical protein